jgi:hypothetical protein
LWWALHFDQLQPAAEGPSALLGDPDGDGHANLLEYALGSAPDSSASRPILESQISNLRLQISFLRAASDIDYSVETSTDLVGWSVIATNPGFVSTTTPVTVIDTENITENPQRFLRLRVQKALVEYVLHADGFAESLDSFGHAQGQSASDGFSWSNESGVGDDSGRVNLIGTANHRDWVLHGGYNATSAPGSGAITWVAGVEYLARVYFLTGASLNPADIFEAGVGFVRNDFSGGFTSHVAGSGVGGGIRQNLLRIYQQGAVVATAPDLLNYQPNTWYELELRLVLTDATTAASLSATVHARGSDGTAPRQTLATVSAENVTIGNNGFSADTFFSGFSGGNNSGANLTAIDAWSVSDLR